jgi:F0F1-type ATP synthase membrane subunit b/b'/uncharacterized coiled-coil protein SlyX
MTAAAYGTRVESLNTQIAAAEGELEQLQDKLVGPIVDKMDAILSVEAKRVPSARTVALSDLAVMAPNGLCNRTGWLAQSYRGEARPLKPIKACLMRRFAYVRVAEVLRNLEDSVAEDRKIRALQDRRQDDLDRFRKEVTRLAAEARKKGDARMAKEVAGQKADLNRRYAAYQAEVSDAERAAHSRMRAQLDSWVAKAQKRYPQLIFVAADDIDERLEPACDATRWVGGLVDKTQTLDRFAACAEPIN